MAILRYNETAGIHISKRLSVALCSTYKYSNTSIKLLLVKEKTYIILFFINFKKSFHASISHLQIRLKAAVYDDIARIFSYFYFL